MGAKTEFERFMNKVVPVTESGCWLWLGPETSGYGRYRVPRGNLLAHRYAYENVRGPIPQGLQLDHLCRVRCCVNPDHLEPVTNRVNALRGVSFSAVNASKTHCKRGHPLEGNNLRIDVSRGRRERQCITCRKAQRRANYLKDVKLKGWG